MLCDTVSYPRFRSAAVSKMALLLALSGLTLCQDGLAQTAQFAYATAVSGLNNAAGVAVDGSGALYIADTGNGRILKETPTGGGYTQTVVAGTAAGTPLYGPFGVAVDRNGSVYIADGNPVTDSTDPYYQRYRVLKETPTGTGYTQTVVKAALSYAPYGVAVDSSGNLFVVEETAPTAGLSRIVKETFTSGVWTEAVAVASLPYSEAYGIAVDAAGDLFVTNTQLSNTAAYSAMYKETLTSGAYTQSTVGSGLNFPYGVALDGSGIVYLADRHNNRVMLETPSGSSYTQTVLASVATPQGVAVDGNGAVYVTNGSQVLQLAGGINFGAQNTASTSATRTLTFNLIGTGTIGSTAVLTQGVTGLDFADAGGSTCIPNAAGPTCTVNVSFTPRAAGLRYGAVNLYDFGGNVLATAYLYGTGAGPRVAFSPGTQSVVTTNSGLDPYGMAVDGNGSVYFCNRGPGQVFQETLRGGSWSRRTVASGLGTPSSVAVDGAGNVYIADVQNGAIYKVTPLPSGAYAAPVTVVGSLSGPWAVTVDGSGNLYVLNTGAGRALKETVSANGYIESVIDQSLYSAYEIAVDAGGNVYIDSQYNDELYKETPSGGTYTRSLVSSTLGYVNGLAVDGTGNLYVANGGDVTELKPAASGTAYTSTVLVSGLNSSSGVAVDGSGNLYIADESVSMVYKQDLADPPSLSFAGTAVGSTSSDSPQIVTLQNIGNAPLSFSVPSMGNNPSLSANFALSPNSTCPQLTSSSSSASLAAGSSCTELLSFVPTQTGTISGALVATDNNLNVAGATQSVPLTGTGTPGALTLTVSPVSIVYGTANATLTVSITYGGVVPTGGVTFSVDSGSTVAASCSSTSYTRTCTASYGTSALAGGSHTIQAAELADSNYPAASASGSLTVTQAMPTLSVASPSIVYGTASATLSAAVAYTGNAAPAGGLSFSVDGGAALAGACIGSSSPLACTVNYSTSTLNGGSHAVAASLAADTNYMATSRGGILTVTPASPALSVASPSIVYGTALTTLTASVVYTGGTAPTGVLNFSVDGGAAVVAMCRGGSSPLTCTASYMTSALNAGSHVLAVSLAPDTNYAAAASNGALIITQTIPVVTIASSSVVYGTASTTLTASVFYTGGAAPTGLISFSVDGGAAMTAVCAGASSPISCTASYATSALRGGSHTLIAREAAGGNYAAADSAIGSLMVTRAPITVTVGAPVVVLGAASARVTATVAYAGAAAPTGGLNVVVDGGTAVVANCTPGASLLVCAASYPTAALTVGAHTLMATELADANYASAVVMGTLAVSDATLFPACALTVGAAATSSAISATPNCGDPQNQPLLLTLNWGDGSSQAAANHAATPHTYANMPVAMPYTVAVTATDSGGRSRSVTQSILVVPSVPVASPGAPAQITTTLSSQPAAPVSTLVTFVCASVSTAVNGQTTTTLPSQFGISCTSPQVDASKTPVPVNVTVQTTAATTTVAHRAFSNTITAFCVLLLPFGTLLPRRGMSRRLPLLAGGFLLLLCFALSSCGGSFTPPPSVATPLGSYYLTITEVVVGGAPAPTGFVQTSLIVPITVGK